MLNRSWLTVSVATAAALVLCVAPARSQTPVTTAFTYQGQLKDAGSAPTGTYDLQFKLFDAATTPPGVQVGGTIQLDNVPVTGGLFTVSLDFGAQFNGNARWLQVGVHPGAQPVGNPYTILAPLQPLTAAPYAQFSSKPWETIGNNISNTNTGNVGIGTSTPAAELHVRAATNDALAELRITPGMSQSNSQILLTEDTGATAGSLLRYNGTDNRFEISGFLNSTEVGPHMVVGRDNGRLGLGTTTPARMLHLRGPEGFARIDRRDNSAGLLLHEYHDNAGVDEAWKTFGFLVDGTGVNDGKLTIADFGAAVSGGSTPRLVIDNTGNVGIGTSVPSAKLEVLGTGEYRTTSNAKRIAIQPNGSFGRADLSMFLENGSTKTVELNSGSNPTPPPLATRGGYLSLYGVDGGNRVVLGDAGPLADNNGILSLYDNNGIRNVTIEANGDSGAPGGEISLSHPNGNTGIVMQASEGNDGGQIALFKSTNQTTASIILDAEHGGVGGHGRIITQVLEITGGADFSEQFDVAAGRATDAAAGEIAPQPGMVVCIDPNNPGKLIVSTSAYDRTVAGVISGAGGVTPGFLMVQRDSVADGEHPVALSGRVYVRCDASHGAIQPGDLLTTSDTPGHGMRVTDHAAAQGAILGKAMGSLNEGRGLVLVLVSLQ